MFEMHKRFIRDYIFEFEECIVRFGIGTHHHCSDTTVHRWHRSSRRENHILSENRYTFHQCIETHMECKLFMICQNIFVRIQKHLVLKRLETQSRTLIRTLAFICSVIAVDFSITSFVESNTRAIGAHELIGSTE